MSNEDRREPYPEEDDTKRAHFSWDAYNQQFRVWRNDAPGDMFDMVETRDLETHLYELQGKGYVVSPCLPEY